MDFSWSSIRASHAVLLCRMEQGEIGGWQEVEKIDRVRHAHAQRHTSHQSNSAKSQEKNYGPVTKNFPCVHRNIPMKQKVCCINTYVMLVGQVRARHTLIPNLIEERKQKTSSFGHAFMSKTSCP